jgi:hypothetical protein
MASDNSAIGVHEDDDDYNNDESKVQQHPAKRLAGYVGAAAGAVAVAVGAGVYVSSKKGRKEAAWCSEIPIDTQVTVRAYTKVNRNGGKWEKTLPLDVASISEGSVCNKALELFFKDVSTTIKHEMYKKMKMKWLQPKVLEISFQLTRRQLAKSRNLVYRN